MWHGQAQRRMPAVYMPAVYMPAPGCAGLGHGAQEGYPQLAWKWWTGILLAAVNWDVSEAGVTTIDPELMQILVCPITHAPLVEVDGWLYSTDAATRRKYPIRDGIPIMLIEESQVVEPGEFAQAVPEEKRLKLSKVTST